MQEKNEKFFLLEHFYNAKLLFLLHVMQKNFISKATKHIL